ncbi:MAG: hypothetical protein JWQ39_2544 [Glaciihabitans sp.]|nr:hypothetical protein [Glaciihabitans sp.]
MVVWIDAWQQQCCGDSFSVGDDVLWDCRKPDTKWLSTVLGDREAQAVAYAEEHHDGGSTYRLAGTILEIDALYCTYDVDPRTRVATPVPGSGIKQGLISVTGQEPDRAHASLSGYLVAVDTPSSR